MASIQDVPNVIAEEIHTFSPPEGFRSKCATGYGTLPQSEFNRLSYEATLHCVQLIREAGSSYHSTQTYLGQERQRIAALAEDPDARYFGVPRIQLDKHQSVTGFRDFNHYAPAAVSLSQFMTQHLPQAMHSLVNAGNYSAEIIGPETLKVIDRSVHEGARAKSGTTPDFDFTDPILIDNRDILETLYHLQTARLGHLGVFKTDSNNKIIPEWSILVRVMEQAYVVMGKATTVEGIVATRYFACLEKTASDFILDRRFVGVNILHTAKRHLLPLSDIIERLWDSAVHWDRQDRQELNRRICRFIHYSAHAMYFERGNGWAVQVRSKAAYKHHNFRLVPYQKDVQIDVKALEYPRLEDFERDYLSFYSVDPTSICESS